MKTVLITGGSGFLGSNLAKFLSQKSYTVITISRRINQELIKLGIQSYSSDIRDIYSLEPHFKKGIDVIFHTAAIADINGRKKNFEEINIQGTKNIVQLAKKYAVKYFINTSSPSVISTKKDILNGREEELKYSSSYLAHYPRTKAIAEQWVHQQCNNDFYALSLRPHLIWGIGDTHLIPRIIAIAKQKKLKKIGSKENIVDMCYIDNAVYAHYLAMKKLIENPILSKNAYFISDQEPVNLWQWINQLLEQLNIPVVNSSIPYPTAYSVGAILEIIYKFFPIKKPIKMTRFAANQLATSHYFNPQKIQKDLGFYSKVDTKKAKEKLVKYLLKQEK